MKIEIKVYSFDNGVKSYVNDFSENDLNKFMPFIKKLKENLKHTYWNWFDHLPMTWDGNNYVLDTSYLKTKFEENFGFNFEDYSSDTFGSINFFKEFFLRFTPDGADMIEEIHIYKIEEIEI